MVDFERGSGNFGNKFGHLETFYRVNQQQNKIQEMKSSWWWWDCGNGNEGIGWMEWMMTAFTGEWAKNKRENGKKCGKMAATGNVRGNEWWQMNRLGLRMVPPMVGIGKWMKMRTFNLEECDKKN
jgi:hypothetical protein